MKRGAHDMIPAKPFDVTPQLEAAGGRARGENGSSLSYLSRPRAVDVE